MANAYKATITNIGTDGTNLFVEVSVFDGLHTLPPLRPVFPVGTTAAAIRAYVQTLADNQPALSQDIADIVGVTLAGA